MSLSQKARSRREFGGEAKAALRRGTEGEGRLGGKVGSGRQEPGTQPSPPPLAGSTREEGDAVWVGGPTMPKVFLVKRRSLGVSVRSWDELPDEKRADTYIPGERGRGVRAWALSSRGGGRDEQVPSAHRLRLDSPPHDPSSRGEEEVSENERIKRERIGNLRHLFAPSP